MKYLSIYEKFDSVIISKTLSFLTKNINKKAANDFAEKLKNILSAHNIDFPISYLEDSDIKYLKKDKALDVREENPSDLDYLKFWFSLENGFMFLSGTGNKILDKQEYRNIIKDKNIIEQVKREVKTGIIRPVTDYKELKHLSKVVGIFSGYKSVFEIGTIWIEKETENIYVIQNSSDGGHPRYANDEWTKYGSCSWFIGNTFNGDHMYLHFYEENNSPLKIINPTFKSEHSLFNLFYNYDELDTNNDISDSLKKVDFALVISVNNLLNKKKSYTKIKTDRAKSRENALALLDDKIIKRVNIERYTKEIFKKFGISDKGLNLNNLEKMITRVFLKEFCFYNIISNSKRSDYIEEIFYYLINILKSDDPRDIEGYISHIFRYYNFINSHYNDYYNLTAQNINKIKSYAKENNMPSLIELMDIFDRISIKMYNSINEDKISNIYYFNSYIYKINSIYSMFINYFSYDTKNLFKYIYDNYDLKLNLEYINDEYIKSELEKAKSIEMFVNKTFI